MSLARYHIEDEPRPGRLERLITDPMWPLFGMVLGAGWIGFLWFIVNGVALGSSTLRREIAWVVGGIAGAAGLAYAALWLVGSRTLPVSAVPYLILVPMTWKLAVGYVLLTLQRRSFALWEHYGGQASRPVFVVIAAFIFGRMLLQNVTNDVLLFMVLG